MYQQVGKSAYKADLVPTQQWVAHLQHPEKSFRSIHVAGTNGKGSTSHMLASVFQEAGYKTGLYTSPHLKDFRERIRVNGVMIPEARVTEFVLKHKPYFAENRLSFFEMTVGMAFDYFESEKVDIAIIETGMGGRLDSTNVITPEISIITNIGRDHTAFLGETLREIAFEKAGIIKENVPVIIGETQTETQGVFLEKAKEKEAKITFADDFLSLDTQAVFGETFQEWLEVLALKGDYQQKNLKTVLTALTVLKDNEWKITAESVRKGLANVISNTAFSGRWQQIGQNPKVIVDTGHNKEGLEWVMAQLSRESFSSLHIVLGVVSDKDLHSVLPLFPKKAQYYFAKPDLPRGMDVNVLATTAHEYGLEGKSYASVLQAYQAAIENASEDDLIFVGGSTFVVAEVL